MPDIDRRTVIRRGTAALAALLAGPRLSAALGGCGPISPTSSDGLGRVTISLADHVALEEVGGFELLYVEDLGIHLAAVRVEAEGESPLVVMDAVCTHAGCLVDVYDRGIERLVCTCHASEFELDGEPVSGPATAPLTVYASTLDGDVLTVDLDEAL
jgi:cytochrome b6-f complex iron-sulfur subunit